MALLVEEIMNRELFSARPTDRVAELITYFTAFGIGASPVQDPYGRLQGIISLRDLIRADANDTVAEHMSRSPVTIEPKSTIDEAARLIANTGYHRLPVVDAEQRLVGIVSSLDLVRALVGEPARHPGAFAHFSEDTGLLWSDDVPLDLDRIEAAPESTGVLALVHGGAGKRERIVWAERAENLRRRLLDMLTRPAPENSPLAHWLAQSPVRFRWAELTDRATGIRVVDILQRRAGYHHDQPPPRGSRPG